MDLAYTLQIRINDTPEFTSNEEAVEYLHKRIKRQFPMHQIVNVQNITLQKVLDVTTKPSTDLANISS